MRVQLRVTDDVSQLGRILPATVPSVVQKNYRHFHPACRKNVSHIPGEGLLFARAGYCRYLENPAAEKLIQPQQLTYISTYIYFQESEHG